MRLLSLVYDAILLASVPRVRPYALAHIAQDVAAMALGVAAAAVRSQRAGLGLLIAAAAVETAAPLLTSLPPGEKVELDVGRIRERTNSIMWVCDLAWYGCS